MAMKITIHQNSSFIVHVPNQLFGVKDSRVKENIRAHPSTVQVYSKKRAPLVSKYNSIHVEHGHYAEYEVLS